MPDTQTQARHVNRRTLLQGIGAAATVVTTSMSGCLSLLFSGGGRKSGSAPISFASQRKRIHRADATVVVHNRAELLDAIVTPDAVIWIPEKVTIDMGSGPTAGNNAIAPNVTIASNRHLGRGKGGIIKTDGYVQKLFVAKGPCRVTGVRLQGPRTDYFDPGDTDKEIYSHASSCVHFTGKTGIVDNCEAYGWTAMAIGLGTTETPTQGWIHHNEMHHNQMNHLGYPMELYNGLHLIEWNYFAKYRHAITAYGYPSNGYEARFNYVGLPGGAPYGFAYDMHSLGEQNNFPESNTTAGKYVNIHHNVFELSEHNAFSISGIPTRYARFCDNRCATSKDGDGPGVPAVSAPAGAVVRMKNNQFGKTVIKRGQRWLRQLARRLPLSSGKPSLTAWVMPQHLQQNKQHTQTPKNKTPNTPTNQSSRTTPRPALREMEVS